MTKKKSESLILQLGNIKYELFHQYLELNLHVRLYKLHCEEAQFEEDYLSFLNNTLLFSCQDKYFKKIKKLEEKSLLIISKLIENKIEPFYQIARKSSKSKAFSRTDIAQSFRSVWAETGEPIELKGR